MVSMTSTLLMPNVISLKSLLHFFLNVTCGNKLSLRLYYIYGKMLLHLRLYYIWCRLLHLGLLSHNDCLLKFYFVNRKGRLRFFNTYWMECWYYCNSDSRPPYHAPDINEWGLLMKGILVIKIKKGQAVPSRTSGHWHCRQYHSTSWKLRSKLESLFELLGIV